jgi:tetratricopeptide (TPR) repeat protein
MKTLRSIFLVAFLLLIVFLLYSPGLTGGYVFDDTHNITDNGKIAIESLDVRTLIAASWSGTAGPLGRPVSMLSFALNHYFTGFDPYFFKLTNLFIHLLNVVLVFWLVYALLRALLADTPRAHDSDTTRLPFHCALLAAALWGLHPLNLTSVLYVVQRMTSLATLFGLFALALYATWRSSRRSSSLRNGLTGLLILLSLLASIFSKESGFLFIPLLLWIELLIFKGMHDGQSVRLGPITLKHLILGGCCLLCLIVLFLLPSHISPEKFYNRDFTLTERVLTESRVMFYYLRLFFLPSLSELGLFHDDFPISQGLLQPLTTLCSILGLIAITIGTLLLRKKAPLWLFAWGWFLISHALESTVFSLELVHEHRNYFATLGFLVLFPWLLWRAIPEKRSFLFLLVGLFVALCGFITWQRAIIWSSRLTHATFEAETHPKSSRTNDNLAELYIKLFDLTKDARYVDLAKQSLQKARLAYKAENFAWFALIILAYRQNETPDPALVRELRQRLRENTLTNANVIFLWDLYRCQAKRQCHMPHDEAMLLFAAALANPKMDNGMRAAVNQIAGLYCTEAMTDLEQGAVFLNETIRLNADTLAHLQLARILRLQGKFAQARKQIELARQLDTKNVWFLNIEQELDQITQAEQKNS